MLEEDASERSIALVLLNKLTDILVKIDCRKETNRIDFTFSI